MEFSIFPAGPPATLPEAERLHQKQAVYEKVQQCRLGLLSKHATDGSGMTLLIWASRVGLEGEVKSLIDVGADINCCNKSGLTALTLASKNGHVSIVKLLLECGARIDTAALGSPGCPLARAVQNSQTEVLRALCRAGAADAYDIADLLRVMPDLACEPLAIVSLLATPCCTRSILATMIESVVISDK